ncbi:BTB/POZ domain-containing protein [Phyllosticta citrichinensis]|uniref:BTB/POZ domain-containing protein n=1 Tax=Phyllosticta citrichinensis TaxID=1130410 RepID=A0ABR1Y4Z2_9PEZI
MYTKKLSEHLQTGEFSDITIVCGDVQIKAHKVVLSVGSAFFRAMLSTKNGFKESTAPVIVLDEDPAILQAMVKYIYSTAYPVLHDANELLKHAKVYIVARYYQISGLQKTARRNFAMTLKHHMDMAKEEAQQDYVDAVRFIYDHVAENRNGVKEEVLIYAAENGPVLRHSRAFMQLMCESPFARDVYIYLFEAREWDAAARRRLQEEVDQLTQQQ